MKKIYRLYLYLILCCIVTGLPACVQEQTEGPRPTVRESRLSVEQARAFFESDAVRQLTRAAADGSVQGVFEVGAPVPDWERAEPSSNALIACVDVPAQTGCEFRILRRRADGTMYEVPAYGRLLVVRSEETGQMATYMRFLVPDELYDASYGCD